MHANPDSRLNVVATLQLNGGVLHPFDKAQAREDCPSGVVLVCHRVAEAGNDAVALELENAPTQLLDRLGGDSAVEDKDVLNDLGFGLLCHIGRLHDVGEHQADEGARPPGRERSSVARSSMEAARAFEGSTASTLSACSTSRSQAPMDAAASMDAKRRSISRARRSSAEADCSSSAAIRSPPQSPTSWAWLT